MARRVVIGKQNDGTYRLRVSLSGNDAFTAADSGLSFDSAWTDIVKLHAIGIADATFFSPIVFPSLGFKPFAEIRVIKNGVIYDDYTPDVPNRSGVGAYVEHDKLKPDPSVSGTFLYLVTNIPVPSQ